MDLTDRQLSPLGQVLRTVHRAMLRQAETEDALRTAANRAYWVSATFPTAELLAVVGLAEESDLLDWIGPGSFEHNCPDCQALTPFTMTTRGYRASDYHCVKCQEKTNGST